jgi:capsid protein
MNTHLFRWGIADGTLPISSKFTPENLPYKLVPRGVYLLDTAKELAGVMAAIGAGLIDFETAAADLGYDNHRDTVRRLEKQYANFRDAGITPNLGHISVRLSNRSEDEEEIPEVEGAAQAPKPSKVPPSNSEEVE